MDLKGLWNESRGNFYGTVLATAFIALLAAVWSILGGFWPWAWSRYTSMQLPARVLGPLLIAVTVVCIVQQLIISRLRRQPSVQIVTPAGLSGPSASDFGGITLDIGPAAAPAKTDPRQNLHYMGQPWLSSDDAAVECVKDTSRGLSVWVRNSGIQVLKDVSLKLISLQSFHEGKLEFRQAQREAVTLCTHSILQPDECTNGAWLAFLSTSGNKELSLPEKSYLPNPETQARTFRAIFEVAASGRARPETLHFVWKPGDSPVVLNEVGVAALKFRTS